MITNTWGSRWTGSQSSSGPVTLSLTSNTPNAIHGAAWLIMRLTGTALGTLDGLLEVTDPNSILPSLYLAGFEATNYPFNYSGLTSFPMVPYNVVFTITQTPPNAVGIVVVATPFVIPTV